MSASALQFWSDAPPAPAANVTGIPSTGGGLGQAYDSASLLTQETYAWRPPLTSADSATLYERNLSGQRLADLLRNDPHARAGKVRLVDMLVGAGLRVSPAPLAFALGLDPKKKKDRRALQDLSLAIKSEWKLFAEDPRRTNDAQRRLSFSGQCRLMAGTFVTRGECTAYLDWRKEPGVRYATCVRTVDPDRLSNPYNRSDGPKLRGGIEYDDRGTPLAYHIREAHLADWFNSIKANTWERIERVTEWGRPVFIHAFEPDREDQSRAITPFSVLLTRLRMITKAGDLELANSAVNALFAAFVSSNLAVADVNQAMTLEKAQNALKERFGYYKDHPPTLAGVRIPVLPPGDEIKLNASPRQNNAYQHFQAAFLQSIAAALGISYEQLSMDWSKVNYSSARAALNEVWRHIQSLLDAFVTQAIMPIYFGVIEEAFDRGHIKPPKGAPDFDDVPAAYLASRWIGPGRGYVDPVKEAQGSSLRMGSLTSSLERECASDGVDWYEMVHQIAHEEEELRALGLTRVVASTGHIVDDPSDPDADPDKAPAPDAVKEAA
jgi:lambda family phage portal protein